jgi:beta-aspartyl-peptidase (threonine type)
MLPYLRFSRFCKSRTAGAIIFFLVWMAPLGADSGAGSIPTKDAVRQVLDSQVAAWNKGDLKGFMAGYWRSDKLTFFSGDKIEHGWQATYDRYQKRYQSEGREMGKLSFSDLDVQMLGDDTAWVRGRWKLVTSKETPGGLFTLIFKKFPEGWRIVHDHTSAGPMKNPGE